MPVPPHVLMLEGAATLRVADVESPHLPTCFMAREQVPTTASLCSKLLSCTLQPGHGHCGTRHSPGDVAGLAAMLGPNAALARFGQRDPPQAASS